MFKTLMAGVITLAAAGAIAQPALRSGPSGPATLSTVAAPTQVPSGGVTPAIHPLTRQDVDTWLDGYMPHALATGDIPGAQVVVVSGGQILTARGFGYADVAKRVRVDPDRTLFRPGSVSKLFTWTAVMQLVEQGRLDLDQDVNRYLDFTIPAFKGRPITLRQILTHTAGFEENGDRVVFYDPKTLQPLSTYLKQVVPKRVYAPGTTPAYSNWATALAGYIVERRSGEPFDTYVERHIFAPLGMRSSSFRQPLSKGLAARLATPYPKPGTTSGFEYVGPGPAGSLSASATDMARFMLAHLGGGALDGGRILRPETARLMHDSPLARVDPASLVPPLKRMELGFFEMDVGRPGVVGHLGDLNAFHTSLDLFVREGVGIYVSVNGSGRDGAGSALRLALPTDFADRYMPIADRPDGRIDAATSKKHAAMVAGHWDASRRAHSSFFSVLYAFGQTVVDVDEGGKLVVPALVGAGGRPREWVETAPFVWRDRDSHERLAAKVENGQVVRWSFDMGAPWEVFDRTPAWRSMAWIQPLLYASLAILLIAVLVWPITWYARKRFKVPSASTGRLLATYRASRTLLALDLAVMGGWTLLILTMLKARPAGPQVFTAWLWLLQGVGIVVLPGAVLISALYTSRAWREGLPWTRKLSNVIVTLAAAHLLYFAETFGLIAMTVDY